MWEEEWQRSTKLSLGSLDYWLCYDGLQEQSKRNDLFSIPTPESGKISDEVKLVADPEVLDEERFWRTGRIRVNPGGLELLESRCTASHNGRNNPADNPVL